MAPVQKSPDELPANAPIRATVLATPEVVPFLEQILQLKAEFWPYPLASQRSWFAEHVAPEDLHVLALDGNDALLGYARIARDDARDCCIIDTMCVSSGAHRKGIGSLVMRAANEAIRMEGLPGLLSCEAGLVPFYASCGWREMPSPLLRADQITMQLPSPASPAR